MLSLSLCVYVCDSKREHNAQILKSIEDPSSEIVSHVGYGQSDQSRAAIGLLDAFEKNDEQKLETAKKNRNIGYLDNQVRPSSICSGSLSLQAAQKPFVLAKFTSVMFDPS